MNWNELNNIEQLAEIDAASAHKLVLVFKHSTRCSISSAAIGRIERGWKEENAARLTPYYLDLIAHRDVSNTIAEHYRIVHESPQVLLIRNGICVYSESHMGIALPAILAQLGD